MARLPDFKRSFEYENNFYLSCDSSRTAKILAHYELLKMTFNIPGHIVACGVSPCDSLSRSAMFRELFMNRFAKKIVVFDAFKTVGEGFSKKDIRKTLERKGVFHNIDLVAGDMAETAPRYLRDNAQTKISFLDLNTSTRISTFTALENFYSRLSRNGILLTNDEIPVQTRAVRDYFKNSKKVLLRLPFCTTLSYIVKKNWPA